MCQETEEDFAEDETTWKLCAFFFMEVKRKGNYHNNNLEGDVAKLGKEMQSAFNNKFMQL